MQQKDEAHAAEMAACQRQLQTEVVQNEEAAKLLRSAGGEITELREALATVQRQRDDGNTRCERLEAALHDTQQQLQRASEVAEQQQQLLRARTEEAAQQQEELRAALLAEESAQRDAAAQYRDEQQRRRRLEDDISALRQSVTTFLRDESDAVDLREPSRLPTPARNGYFSSLHAAAVRGDARQPVEAQKVGRRIPSVRSATPVDARLDAQQQDVASRVVDAVEVLLYARDYALRQHEDEQEQQRQGLASTSPGRSATPSEADRVIAAECISKLMGAVAALNAVRLTAVSPTPRVAAVGAAAAASSSASHRDGNARLVEHLQQHQRTLSFVLKEARDAATVGLRCLPAAAVLVQDPLIETLLTTLVERLSTVAERLQRQSEGEPDFRIAESHSRGDNGGVPGGSAASGGSRIAALASPFPRPPRAEDDAAEAEAAVDGSPARRLYANGGSSGNATLRHTFGFTGGRLEVSHGGTRLQRLLLPGVVDLMACSALGALDHRTFLDAQQGTASPPSSSSSLSSSCFAFTVRVGMHCEGVLVGFADRYLPLEGFGPAQNSLRYTSCYYLHLGRGTLYCPAQGIVDAPYRAFQRAGASAAVRVGEEVTCTLNTASQVIRYSRNGVDCGVAFERVSLTRALFPAFEVNSRGCTIEFA
ncbi:hypothetical protein DQ04_15571000 [Trypanosoma grayi]|uniref:hypothetical protein n=1 Tax=Trypanosoma grayi TaxID=71804 RepID=UPI0004F46B53|nr:hypothetical protein DQ04_15571000 [Trypanosoma grayi]KEG06161.1 hypothetical protein DQ04_15571000 [Trypanosoma grayi]